MPILSGLAAESAVESADYAAYSSKIGVWVQAFYDRRPTLHNRLPTLHNRLPTLCIVGRLSVLNMSNIWPPIQLPDGNRPTGIGRWESADCTWALVGMGLFIFLYSFKSILLSWESYN